MIQECIPVGFVPPAVVAVHVGGVCLSACWDTQPPQVWAWGPPRCGPGAPQCGPGDPPGYGPGDLPLGVGLETPLARPLNFPPGCGPGDPFWRPARHAGIPPARHAGIPPPL